MRHKVSVIGAGNVGATCAQYILENKLADVVLVDKVEGLPQGKALDMMAAGPSRGFDADIKGSNDYADTADSDIVVITAGLARQPGMSREDLLAKNVAIVKSVTEDVSKRSPKSIIIVVTNPLDVMSYLAWKISGFKSNKVIGMAGVLDSARFRCFLAKELKVSAGDIQAMVLGGHGDSMVPLARFCTVAGVPVTELLSKEKLDKIIERTKNAGAEVVAHLKTGSAYYSPAASVVEMVECILKDKKRLLPASAYLNGEYGLKDLYIGVPVILGASGVEKVLELPLTAEEKKLLGDSASVVSSNIKSLNL
ncbi:MAG: malate dehydrogenase [Candidatus Omnitrophica bacterium]|nr:malate dehydrogenase [Candidatus Omnitrophota bacterium]